MRLFIDTNVCSKAASGIDVGTWFRVKRQRTERGLKYVVCPLVVVELLDALVASQDQFFDEHKRRFEVLRDDAVEYLRFPGDFAMNAVYGVSSAASRLGPSDFRQWVEIVCRAQNREELRQGNVPAYGSDLVTFGLDARMLQDFRETGLKGHKDRMQAIRGSSTDLSFAPRPWALAVMRSQGIVARDAADLDRFGEQLNAAYQYDKHVSELASNTTYRFDAKERSGDRIDSELLYYLSAPDIHIITGDRNLRERCRSSPQSARIWLISELA